MKYSKKFAVFLVVTLTLVVVPICLADIADAKIVEKGQASASGFYDNGGGHIDYTLINSNEEPVSVKIVVCDYNTDNNKERATWEGEIPGSETNGGVKTINLSGWSYDSPGDKYVYVKVYDNGNDNEKENVEASEIVKIRVKLALWRPITIIIIVVLIVVIAVIYRYVRDGGVTKSGGAMREKIFTKLHRERMEKKSGHPVLTKSEKQTYNASPNRVKHRK